MTKETLHTQKQEKRVVIPMNVYEYLCGIILLCDLIVFDA